MQLCTIDMCLLLTNRRKSIKVFRLSGTCTFIMLSSLYFIWKKISTCLKLLHHFYATELKWKNVKAGKMVICEKRSSCMVGWCSVIYKWCLGHQIIILLHRINIWIFFKIKKTNIFWCIQMIPGPKSYRTLLMDGQTYSII